MLFTTHVLLPEGKGFDWYALAAAVIAFVGLLSFKWGMIPVIIGSALAGYVWKIFIFYYGGTVMPPTEKHFETSKERTGQDYAGLHRWIDDPDHKNERHDFTRIWDFAPQISSQYGEEGVREYIEHLREDMEKKFKKIRHEYKAAMQAAYEYFGIKRREE